MSNFSVGSSGCSTNVGGSSKCWCGKPLVTITSKTSTNPYRRFYRCAYAAAEKLSNDKHIFKWVDESLEKEIEKLNIRALEIEGSVAKIKKILEEVDKVFEKMEGDIQEKVYERLEPFVIETEARMKKMCWVLIFGFLILGLAIYVTR